MQARQEFSDTPLTASETWRMRNRKGVVLILKSNGKAVYMGTSEFNFDVDGKDVKLHMPQGVLILKGHNDGSLDFPFIGNLKKMPS